MVDLITPPKQLFVKGYKSYFWLILFFASNFICHAQKQSIEDLKNWQLRDVYKNAELAKDNYTVIDCLEELNNRKVISEDEEYSLALAFFNARDNESALEWFEYLKNKNPKDPKAYYYYGETLRSTGLTSTALEYFQRFYRDIPKNSNDYDDYEKKIKNTIAACEFAINSKENDAVNVYRLNDDINLPHNETAPYFVSKDLMYYASIRTNNYRFDGEKNIPRKELHLAYQESDTIFKYYSDLSLFKDSTADFDNPFYFEKLNRLYFNKCQYQGNKNVCRLYYCSLDSNKLGPITLSETENIIDSRYSVKQACFFEKNSKNYMIFVSDLPGGEGGLDLWYLDLKRPQKIVNLGKNINTVYDEETPWFDVERNRLYFSSNGHPGFGGTDIFKSDGFGKKWTIPDNIGKPINSSYDDTYYSHRYEQDSISFGFFTSNRPGGNSVKSETCCDDIFYFKTEEQSESELSGGVDYENLVEGKIDGDYSKATVRLFRVSGDNEILVETTETDSSGKYAFAVEIGKKYSVLVSREGFLSKKATDTIRNTKTVIQDFTLFELSKEPIVIKNIYYPFDESYITDNSSIILDTTVYPILLENPGIIIEISSHTDFLGPDIYNERLSQSRAESVVKYLIEKGINPERLVAKGYGESQPIAPNQKPDGRDDPEGRAKNRRTEFRIIGVLPQYEDVIYEE